MDTTIRHLIFWLLFPAACSAPALADAEDGATDACDADDTTCSHVDGDHCDCAADADGADPLPDRDPGGATGDTGSDAALLPGEVLDLTNWKLTLPFGEDGDPVEIQQPELEQYTNEPHFRTGDDGTVVVFNANAGGVTTSGSHFPRSELREMLDGGHTEAAWSTTSGVHTMTVVEAITHLPEVVPHVVAGQVHDANEYVMLVRLDGNRLWVKSGDEEAGVLDADYTLGEEFTLRIAVADGWIDVYYNDLETPAVELPYQTTGCYFKAGAYLQTNTEYGDAADAYAEVAIRDLVVTHE